MGERNGTNNFRRSLEYICQICANDADAGIVEVFSSGSGIEEVGTKYSISGQAVGLK